MTFSWGSLGQIAPFLGLLLLLHFFFAVTSPAAQPSRLFWFGCAFVDLASAFCLGAFSSTTPENLSDLQSKMGTRCGFFFITDIRGFRGVSMLHLMLPTPFRVILVIQNFELAPLDSSWTFFQCFFVGVVGVTQDLPHIPMYFFLTPTEPETWCYSLHHEV